MSIFLTQLELLNFLRSVFRIEPEVINSKLVPSGVIIIMTEIDLYLTIDVNSGGYIDNLRISDSGKKYGFFLFLDCITGLIHLENKHGVLAEGNRETCDEVFEDFHSFFMRCESPKIKAKLRDIKIDKLLK